MQTKIEQTRKEASKLSLVTQRKEEEIELQIRLEKEREEEVQRLREVNYVQRKKHK